MQPLQRPVAQGPVFVHQPQLGACERRLVRPSCTWFWQGEDRMPLRAILLLGILATACTGPSDVQDILRVTRVDVDPGNVNLQIGSSFQFNATARTGSGIIVTNRPVHWTSNAPDQVSVSATGLVTAARVGAPVQITATIDGIPGSAMVTVSPEPITSITITPRETTLPMGSSAQFAASATDGSGQLILGAIYTWRSSDPSIVDVTTSGRVFALAPGGPVTITASNGTVSGTAMVTVTQVASRLVFTQQPSGTTVGQPLSQVRVTVLDPAGNPIGNSTAQISLRLGNNPGGASLTGTLTVNASSGVATWTDLRLDRPGTGYTLIASAAGLLEGTSAAFDVAPVSLTITAQPSPTAVSGQPLSQQPVIQVRNGAGNPLAGIAVTASIGSGGGTLGGTATVTSNSSGLATFTNLAITGSAGSRTLRFDAPGATGISSTSILVSLPPPSSPPHLTFVQQPTAGTIGRPLTPAIQVAVQDPSGTVSSSSAAITLALGNNPSGATLGGNRTVNAVNGIATFSDLVVDKSGTGYTLTASSSGVTGTTSAPFNVTGISLTISIDASATATSGVPFSQQPVITVWDAGNRPLSGIAVTASIVSGGGTLSGVTSMNTNGSGAAIFTDLSISGVSGSRTLQFAASGAIPVSSGSIMVTSPPSILAFTQQPPNGPVGQTLNPPILVSIRDQYGSMVPGSTNSVTVQLGNNPGNAVLSGTLTVSAVNGVATFGNLALNKPGTGYTLTASSPGLTSATSSGFNVSSVSLTITTQPSATASNGQPLAQQPVITVRDGANQPLAGIPVTVAIASGGGVLSGTTTVTSNSSGVASFTNLAITGSAGSRTLSFTAAAVTPVISNPIVVSVTPTQLTFIQQPTTGTVGQVLTPPVQVAIQDASGNTVTTSSSPVTIQLGSNPGTATLSGTLTVNAVNGVATFSNLVLDKPGTGYTLIASSSGLPSRTSAAFNIGPVSLTITTQPSSSVPNGQAFPQQPVITVRNGANALMSGAAVTVSIATGGGTLGGITTVTSNQSGIATFTNLSITGTTGSRTLSFAASGAASVTSTAIAITPGPATQLTITVQPSSTAARNVVFVQQPVIQLRDASGNPVSQSGVPVTAALASGPGNANLNGTTTVNTNSSGVATFTNLQIDRQGTFTIRFTSGSLQSVISGSITIP